MNKLLPAAYIIGNIVTFLVITVEDAAYTSGVLTWLFTLGINEFLAMIWPLYWTILRWIH